MDVVALVLEVAGALSCLIGAALIAWAIGYATPPEEVADGLENVAVWFGGAALLIAGAGLQAALTGFWMMAS